MPRWLHLTATFAVLFSWTLLGVAVVRYWQVRQELLAANQEWIEASDRLMEAMDRQKEAMQRQLKALDRLKVEMDRRLVLQGIEDRP